MCGLLVGIRNSIMELVFYVCLFCGSLYFQLFNEIVLFFFWGAFNTIH